MFEGHGETVMLHPEDCVFDATALHTVVGSKGITIAFSVTGLAFCGPARTGWRALAAEVLPSWVNGRQTGASHRPKPTATQNSRATKLRMEPH